MLLPAGSVAVATRSGVSVHRGTLAEAERAVEWRGGRLYFDDTPLSVAAEEFNRYNTQKLVMGDAKVAALRIGGNFRWSNPEGFVRLLEQGFDPALHMLVHAVDLSEIAFQMCYLQVNWAGIAAYVEHGNSLSLESFEGAWTIGALKFHEHHGHLSFQKPEREYLVEEEPMWEERPFQLGFWG